MILETINNLLLTLITVGGVVIMVYLYISDRRKARKSNLRAHLKLFYLEEDIAVEWIAQLTKKNAKTIMIELRDKVEKDHRNVSHKRPNKDY